MYLVHVDPPSKIVNVGWDFKDDYFPRKIAYKKDAKVLAKEAESKGGKNVRIEKIKK